MTRVFVPSPSSPLAQLVRPRTRTMTQTRFRSTGVVITSAVRTPIGSFLGSLSSVTAPDLGSTALKAAIGRSNLQPTDIQELYFGNVVSAQVGQSPARQVALASGCPVGTEATTINKVCASGLKAVMLACQNVELGHRTIMGAGGMESMSNTPFYIKRANNYGHSTLTDSIIHDGLWDVFNQVHMGVCGDKTAQKHSISRAEQDDYAERSYSLATKAWESGAFDAEVVPVVVKSKKGAIEVKKDEEYTKFNPEKARLLKPVFSNDGSVTAANASPVNDGASAVVLMTREEATKRGIMPLVEILAYADAATEPMDFPIAPSLAVPIAVQKAGLTLDDIDRWEINEAFSSVALANQKLLNIPLDKINVRGGAVALGHPIGSSGCRILVTLIHVLEKGQVGCAAICNGGGAASAMVVRKL